MEESFLVLFFGLILLVTPTPGNFSAETLATAESSSQHWQQIKITIT